MFCCSNDTQGQMEVYEIKIRQTQDQEIVKSIIHKKDIPLLAVRDPRNQIISVVKVPYQKLLNNYSNTDKKMTDREFPPDLNSLGNIIELGSITIGWKRISEILKDPVLFDDKIQPADVVQGSLGDCYFLSSLAALAENPQIIQNVLQNQTYNKNGIYKVRLRIDGLIREIIVDDYFPINQQGQPIFCQPRKNQFWVLVLQKAWAKAQGSYSNISCTIYINTAGSPAEVFKAVTFAPSYSITIKKNDEGFLINLWQEIQDKLRKRYPCVCGTGDNPNIVWKQLGLSPQHAYTVLKAGVLQDKQGNKYPILQLRNPWADQQWRLQGNQKDKQYWNKMINSIDKTLLQANNEISQDGIFFIPYKHFCKYFSQIHFCLMEKNANYISQPLITNGKNGSLFEVQIEKEGDYTFELHQQDLKGQNSERIMEGLGRGSIILFRQLQKSQYEFIDGKMEYSQQDVSLHLRLTHGIYILYAKLYPTITKNILPTKSSVSVYSVEFTTLNPIGKDKHPNIFSNGLLNYGRKNKSQILNNGQMWISQKNLVKNGGIGYIALGNGLKSQYSFELEFDEREFNQYNFLLRKPYKRKGKQKLKVMPGQQKVIVLRLVNKAINKLVFPPKFQLTMNPIH